MITMAFIRWGVDGSQVYIYRHISGDTLCLDCLLRLHQQPPHYVIRDLADMLAHLAAHRAEGHIVPPWVDQHLIDEWDDDEAPGPPRAGQG
jgi:hypothetical protein